MSDPGPGYMEDFPLKTTWLIMYKVDTRNQFFVEFSLWEVLVCLLL